MRFLILSNFIAEPTNESLIFWNRKLNIGAEWTFGPFNQIHQQLLEHRSQLRANADRLILLIQLEQWSPNSIESNDDLRPILEQLVDSIRIAELNYLHPIFVIVFPISPKFARPAILEAETSWLGRQLNSLGFVDFLSSADFARMYPTENANAFFNPVADRSNPIPFSRLGYATLGTVLFRRLHLHLAPLRKVIVVDCDNTLWKGIVSENPASEILITPERRMFQEFLIRQVEDGRLLCVCSKNDEHEILQFLSERPDCLIKTKHLAGWRINWESKATNLVALSRELNLPLATFIFVDDDPFECASVGSFCPDVLTFCLPENDKEIAHFLNGIWEFDFRSTTKEDLRRTSFYQQNLDRERTRRSIPSVTNFLKSLNLRVTISKIQIDEVPRAVQLTERTNQFNLNGVRRSISELEQSMHSPSCENLIVKAEDRFGDYGIVGFIQFTKASENLRVETLVLSCRALGKRIEHQIFAALAMNGRELGSRKIHLVFRKTGKNESLVEFLTKTLDATFTLEQCTLDVDRVILASQTP
jgi:FkbH-like protein